MKFFRIAEEDELCKKWLDPRSDGSDNELFRFTRRARLIADFVLDKQGGIDRQKAEKVLEAPSFPPVGQLDRLFFTLVKQVLHLFLTDKESILRLKQLSFPLANRYIDEVIRETLLLPPDTELEKRMISLAFLSALMTPLRQTVGSCFATAPIILTQTEKLPFLVQDLYDLITRGFIKRVIEGDEIIVPISTKTGSNKETNKAHFQSPLMKLYEYTIAGLADWKIDFSTWNIYEALGLSHDATGGIGEAIYRALDFELQKTNEKIIGLHADMERTRDQVQLYETLLRNAYREEDIRRHKTSLQGILHHLHVSEDLYHTNSAKAEKLTLFFRFLIDQIVLLFPSYFQEVYDPDMVSEEGEIYEDRPAGFRLLCKHGRSEAAVWTMVYNEEGYKQSLIEYFQMIEGALITAADWKEGKDLIREVLDKVVAEIRKEEFVPLASKRVISLHKQARPQSKPRTPWSYESGGNTEALIKCYWNLRQSPPKHIIRPSTPLELLTGLIEWMKDLPYTVTKSFESNPEKAFLMTNAVHAFLFKPGYDPNFLKAWTTSGNSYTYVRDEFIQKKQPWIFADSNWSNNYLGFVVHPKTGEVEIARIQGNHWTPLSNWNGLFQGLEWTLFMSSF